MTLDEARTCLGVGRDASPAEIHRAFRARARDVHPDRHPGAADADRARLSLEFDRARTARDALLSWSALAPVAPAAATPPRSTPAPEPAPRPRARPRTSDTRRDASAPRVTMRFEEFVAFTDAAGFGIGPRSPRWIDWPRIAVVDRRARGIRTRGSVHLRRSRVIRAARRTPGTREDRPGAEAPGRSSMRCRFLCRFLFRGSFVSVFLRETKDTQPRIGVKISTESHLSFMLKVKVRPSIRRGNHPSDGCR